MGNTKKRSDSYWQCETMKKMVIGEFMGPTVMSARNISMILYSSIMLNGRLMQVRESCHDIYSKRKQSGLIY